MVTRENVAVGDTDHPDVLHALAGLLGGRVVGVTTGRDDGYDYVLVTLDNGRFLRVVEASQTGQFTVAVKGATATITCS